MSAATVTASLFSIPFISCFLRIKIYKIFKISYLHKMSEATAVAASI